MPSKMKKIVLEEHFSTPKLAEYARDVVAPIEPSFLAYAGPRLMDFEQQRIEDMDKNGIDMCVLSANSPGVQLEPNTETAVQVAVEMNDLLAAQMNKYPTRFSGFAHLALQDPAAAAKELERCVQSLGMKGALINGHTNGEYLDHEKFWPVWEKAEELGVPIYLHPADPPVGAPPPPYTEMAGPGWTWGGETAAHVLRLIYSGVFDRFPKTTLILGHMGETLPYILWRLDSRYAMLRHGKQLLKQVPSQYIRDNVMITTSGSFSAAPLLCAMLALGSDRIMFSVDYPYEHTEEAVQFIDNAPISELDRAKICHGNVQRLLKL